MPKAFAAILILLLLCFTFVFVPEVKAAWLTGWTYRKSHIINNATGAGTNYQVKIIVHYGSGSDSGENVYSNSHCRTDFGDIRFTDNDETTLLDYWIESKTDSDNATFWVEVADDLSTVDVTIYFYYGKTDATTISNGTNTFPTLFDDFEDGTVGAAPEGWAGDTGNFKVRDDQANQGSQSLRAEGVALAWRKITKSITASGLFAVEISMREDVLASAFSFELLLGATKVTWVGFYLGGDLYYYTVTYVKIMDNNADQWYKVRLIVNTDDDDYDIYVDAVLKNANVAFRNNVASVDTIRLYTYGSTYRWMDSLFIREYVDPEPAHGSWGSEEGEFFVTFYNNTGGILRVNNVTVANGTETKYPNTTQIELVAIVEGNLTYGFANFTWDSTYNISNPYDWTIVYGVSNLTLWCYFGSISAVVEERAFGTLGFVVAVIAVAIGAVIIGKKLL